jgi:hypothetical protein
MREPNEKKLESLNKQDEEKVLLKFLELTKDGKYAIIEKSSLGYIRTSEETEFYESSDEFYYYSLS